MSRRIRACALALAVALIAATGLSSCDVYQYPSGCIRIGRGEVRPGGWFFDAPSQSYWDPDGIGFVGIYLGGDYIWRGPNWAPSSSHRTCAMTFGRSVGGSSSMWGG